MIPRCPRISVAVKWDVVPVIVVVVRVMMMVGVIVRMSMPVYVWMSRRVRGHRRVSTLRFSSIIHLVIATSGAIGIPGWINGSARIELSRIERIYRMREGMRRWSRQAWMNKPRPAVVMWRIEGMKRMMIMWDSVPWPLIINWNPIETWRWRTKSVVS